MTTFALTGFQFSLFLHISAVMVGFGSTFALAIATPIALKLDPRHLPYVHQLSLALNRYFASPALVVVLVTGLYQVSEGDFKFGDAWISATFAILIVLGGIIGAFFIPSAKRLKALSERDIAASGGGPVTMSDEYKPACAPRGDRRADHRAAAGDRRLLDGREAGRVDSVAAVGSVWALGGRETA